MDNTGHINSHFIPKKELLNYLNPHLQTIYTFDKQMYEVKTYKAEDLFFSSNRFDLVAKYIYIYFSQQKYNTNWHKEVYKEHIRVFSNNTFKENDGLKNSIEDYYEKFEELIDSVGEKGFDTNISILPVDEGLHIIDGAHRLAVSFFLNQNVTTVNLKGRGTYDYSFFVNGNISQKITDFIAFKYCELNQRARIVNIFPITNIPDTQVESILRSHGDIYYKKSITLTKHAQDYVVREMYLGEHWVGNIDDNYSGALYRSEMSFKDKNTLKVYIFIPTDPDSAIKAKAEIRRVIDKGNFPIHINDTQEETIRLAQTYFNDNSLHFINHKKNHLFEKFDNLFEKYKLWISENEYNKNDFCIDSSSTLSAYGLREGADLDFLYAKQDDIKTDIDLIDCHNTHSHFYKKSIDNIIYNPKNHFYYEGYKFISIQLLRAMKVNRNEEKDIRDIMLIDNSLPKKKKDTQTLSLRNLYLKIRLNANLIIPKDSILWNVTKKTFYFLKKIKNRNKNTDKYYSQTGQDEYLDTKIFKRKQKGFFLDIGAHDGVTISNTYFFEKKRNWKGICIEPLPNIFKQLEKNRNVHLVNGCIGDENKTEKFLKIEGYSEMLSGLSKNYDPKHLERIDKELEEYGGEKEEIDVKCYNINDILQKFNAKSIDYCSIDVEGSEFLILKTIDFDRFDIKVLTVENNYQDNEMRDFMENKGYKLHTRLGADDLYIKK